SVKTRTALKMIERAEERGELTPDSIIVEPTSGNQGVGLALVAAVKGYAARIIMPDSCSVERRRIMEHYGAEVICVHDEGDIGACIEECIALAQRMAAEDPRVFVPQQFVNRDNLAAHVDGTAAEILADVRAAGIAIDGFCSGFGTGGTITGIGSDCARSSRVQIWPPSRACRTALGRRHRHPRADGHRRRHPARHHGHLAHRRDRRGDRRGGLACARRLARRRACLPASPRAPTWRPLCGWRGCSARTRPW
ncbi:MAG: pyridoxal-phosphate dependent enzyme, partial [Adlercreutzia equolifaciens]